MINRSEFKNPPVKYRIKPFWFWNGTMTKEEISRQIDEMADKGLGGMFICARQGMTVPYLSREWFELVQFACDRARAKGLEAWLYDEYPYPSGMSGGEVLLEHPEAEHMVLNHKSLKVQGAESVEADLGWSRILLARAYRVNENGGTIWSESLDLMDDIGNLQTEKIYQQTGLTKYNNKRFFSYGPRKILRTVLPEGSWKIEIYAEAALGDFKYYGGFFDPCNEAAVETFIETTHERYRKAIGDRFGVSVHGMFSDEVGLLSPIPWSTKLPKAFEERNGYSLLECLPAIHDDTMEHACRIRYDLYETAHELFRDTYHKKVADWCRDHDLLYATEVPSMRLGTQKYSDIIGGDTAHEKLGQSLEWIYDEYISNYRSNAKAVSSLARQLDKPYAMIESFHSVGWTMTLQDAKWMIDRLGSSGINLYNFHAFYYTIQDITKHDAPPSQFLQNPYWKHYRKLADYVGRMGVLVTNTEADSSIAVLDPTAALWTKLGNPFHGFPYKGELEKEKAECDGLRRGWVELCKTLLFHQLDYDHLDAEILEEARIEGGKVKIGRAAYSVIIMPACHCMEAGARIKLEEFVSQGGCLISTGELPYTGIDGGESDAVTEESWNALFEQEHAYRVREGSGIGELLSNGGAENLSEDRDTETLLDIVEQYRKEPVRVKVLLGNPKAVIACVRFDEDGTRYVFVANQGKGAVSVLIEWKDENRQKSGSLKAEVYDLENGEAYPISLLDGEKAVEVTLGSFESRWMKLMVLDRACDERSAMRSEMPEASQPSPCLTIPMAGLWRVNAQNKNICRFAHAELSLDREEWKDTEVKTFIEQCDETKLLEKQQLIFAGTFGTPKKILPSYPITCWYRLSFRAEEVPEDLSLMMDRETIAGEHDIFVNGRKVEPDQWEAVWVDDQNNREVNIFHQVHKGSNVIEIKVTAEQDEDGLRDPIYLRGSFGISGCCPTGTDNTAADRKQADIKLVPLIHEACPDTPWCEGYPYYSGDLSYEKTFSQEELLPALSGEMPKQFSVNLGYTVTMADCVEVLINGQSLGVRAFAPYRWKCESKLIQAGENLVTVRVTNTLANMLDGTYFDYERHQLVNI